MAALTHNPPHPGEVIREDCLNPMGLSITVAAAWLDVPRQSLSKLLDGENGLSADMAIRLEKAGWGHAETWLGLQLSHDLWRARQHANSIRLRRSRGENAPVSC